VDSVVVVLVDLLADKTPQVHLIQNTHVIEKLPANAADPSFGNAFLPWTPKGRSLRLDSNLLDRLSDPF
jgi:hypothetical protein